MKALVKINYKSGISETYWFEKFECEYAGGKLTSLNWKPTYGDNGPLFIGIADIESIRQLDYSNED